MNNRDLYANKSGKKNNPDHIPTWILQLRANLSNSAVCVDIGENEMANHFANQSKHIMAEAGFNAVHAPRPVRSILT